MIDPQHPETLYAAACYKSIQDDGRGSKLECSELRAAEPIACTITSLAIDPQNTYTVYAAAGYSTAGVFKTTDGGASWRQVSSAPQGFRFGDPILLVDPQNSSTLYAGPAAPGILKSTDAGASWAPALRAAGFITNTGAGIGPAKPEHDVRLLVSAPAPLPWKCSAIRQSLQEYRWRSDLVGSGSGLTGTDFDPQDTCSCGATNLGLAVDPAIRALYT